jgi:hypothetical protein
MSSPSRQPANILHPNFWLVAGEDAVRLRASKNRKNYANAVGSEQKRSKRCIMAAKGLERLGKEKVASLRLGVVDPPI